MRKTPATSRSIYGHSSYLFGIPTASYRRGSLVGYSEMLCIMIVDSSSEAVRILAEGRLTSLGVEEIRRSFDAHGPGGGMRLTLDPADVSFVDAAGIELLRTIRGRGVTFLNLSTVVEQLIDVASCDDTGGLD